MIDLIDTIIESTQSEQTLGGRVYREYPAVNAMDGQPFAVVAHSGHGVLSADERGSEIIAQLAYTVRVYAGELETVDSVSRALINIYNQMGIDFFPLHHKQHVQYQFTAIYLCHIFLIS